MKERERHTHTHTWPIGTELCVKQDHFMKDEYWARTSPHTHRLLSLCFMCNSVIYERWVLSMYHSTHKHITYYQCALCATGSLYERQVPSIYHSAHKHTTYHHCALCATGSLMKDMYWACTTPHTTYNHCALCATGSLYERRVPSTYHSTHNLVHCSCATGSFYERGVLSTYHSSGLGNVVCRSALSGSYSKGTPAVGFHLACSLAKPFLAKARTFSSCPLRSLQMRMSGGQSKS